MKNLNTLRELAEAAKKKKRKKKPVYNPIILDPPFNVKAMTSDYVAEAKVFYKIFGEELFNDVCQKVLSEEQFPKKGKVTISAIQKSMAYNMAALSAAAALVATKVLVDPNFAKNNQSLSARFNDALQRAMNVVASDGSILQRLKYNTNLSTFVTNEEFATAEFGIPHSVIEKVYNMLVQEQQNSIL